MKNRIWNLGNLTWTAGKVADYEKEKHDRKEVEDVRKTYNMQSMQTGNKGKSNMHISRHGTLV